jgi:hypothetical protein
MPKLSYTAFNEAQRKRQLAKREVDFNSNAKDRLCVSLLATGRSNHLIRKLTGYSDGQIRYRANLADVSRQDYRDGVVRVYTRMTLKIESTENFQAKIEKHLRRTVPAMFSKNGR